MEAREPLPLQHDDAPAPPGQRRGGGGAAGATADHRHVVVPPASRAAHSCHRRIMPRLRLWRLSSLRGYGSFPAIAAGVFLLRQGPAPTSTSTSSYRRPIRRHGWPPSARGCWRSRTPSPRSDWRSPWTARPSTTCESAARSRWRSIGRSRWTRCSRATECSAGVSRTSPIRTSRRRLYYEYYPQMTSQVQLVQQDLKKHPNINVKITKLDYTTYYGRYVEGQWDGMAWGFQSGHAVGLDERTYVLHALQVDEEFLCVNDPTIDELVTKLRQTPDRTEQRAIANRVADREHDQVLSMWMPYDSGFVLPQPHVRNAASGILRRTDAHGASAIARVGLR